MVTNKRAIAAFSMIEMRLIIIAAVANFGRSLSDLAKNMEMRLIAAKTNPDLIGPIVVHEKGIANVIIIPNTRDTIAILFTS